MNQDQAKHMVRMALASGGPVAALLVSNGLASADQVSAMATTIDWAIGIVPPIAAVVWGLFDHTDAAKIASVEAMPAVKKILIDVPTATPELDDAVADTSRPKIAAFPAVGVGGSPVAPRRSDEARAL